MTSSLVHHLKPLPLVNSNWSYGPETLNLGRNQQFCVPCDLEIWWMTLKNNRAPLLCWFKLCASFHSHRWIQTKVTVRKRSIRFKIGDLLSRVTLKFDGWSRKNNRAPLLCCSNLYASFHSHRWIQTKVTVRKCSNQVKISDFLSCVTLKFDLWPLLSNIKLYASYHHHMWIQTGVTVRKRISWVMTLWPWPLTYDIDLLHGHHFCHW